MAKPGAEDDQDKTIEDLKRRADELSGGQMEVRALDDCSADTEKAFWKYVVAWEEAPRTTNFQQLEDAGVALPSPDSLTDQELTVKLWEMIHALALFRIFISQTDHLTDRELYGQLWTDCLREEINLLPLDANSACHIQMLGSCSEEDNRLYLKYYADEAWRRDWQEDFPDDPIPEPESPSFDRDRLLPKAYDESPANWEPN